MNRRELLAMLAAAAAPVRAQQYRDYPQTLADYTARLARSAYELRNRALAALKTPADIKQRQAWVRDTFWRIAGGRPAETPLNVKTTGSFERKGYKVDKLYYESQPGVYIAANLYIPTSRSGPFPGVLFQMGHSRNGKGADTYQKCCQGLARLGYLVLAFDPMGQGERLAYPKFDSADDEHSYPGAQMMLVGDTATRMHAWDSVRSLDVLASHPLVDKSRLASTGQSGGGTATMFLITVDDRLACAAVSSGNTENVACADFQPPGSIDDAEQDFLGSGTLGFDRWDTLYPMAPKPLLILVSARDFFGTYSPNYIKNGKEEYTKLARIYETLGQPRNLTWGETPLPHALAHDMRVKIYRFFERTLHGSDKAVEEPEVQLETDETLKVGLPAGKDAHAVAVDRLRSLKPDGKMPFQPPAVTGKLTVLGRADAERAFVDAVEVESESGVFLPGWVFVPKSGPTRRKLIILEPGGRNSHWREEDVYHKLAAAGVAVGAFDIRGVGDLRPKPSRFGDENGYAWAGLILGRTLLEQRVADLIAIIKASGPGQTTLAARGALTVPALFAAAFTPELSKIYLSNTAPSFASVVETREYTQPLSNFYPNVLAHIDIPQLKERLGNRCTEGTAWDVATLAGLTS